MQENSEAFSIVLAAGARGICRPVASAASTGIDDATATTVSAVASLTAPSVPAARLAKAARAALL